MDKLAVVLIGSNNTQVVVIDKTTCVEILLHRKSCAQQPDSGETGCVDLPGRCIGNVQDWFLDFGLNLIHQLVHCVGTQDQEISSGGFQILCCIDHELCGFVPAIIPL